METDCEVCGRYHGSVGDEIACWRADRHRLRDEAARLKAENVRLRAENAKHANREASMLTECLDLARRLERYEQHAQAAE